MSPQEQEKLAQTRFIVLSAMRIGGALIMLLGLWIWKSDALRPGGWPLPGIILLVMGIAEMLVVPQILARMWRTPPGP